MGQPTLIVHCAFKTSQKLLFQSRPNFEKKTDLKKKSKLVYIAEHIAVKHLVCIVMSKEGVNFMTPGTWKCNRR